MKNYEYPLVTVVTETYKNFEYLVNNIKSVLRQNYPYIEYFIADDGSGNFPIEEVKKIIEKYKKKNIMKFKFLVSEQNRGTVKNEGNAYRIASGEILMPLAGDDEFYDENVISNVVKVFQEKKCEALAVSRVAVDEKKEFKYFLPHKIDYKKIMKINTPKQQYHSLLTGEFYNMASGSVLYLKKEMFNRLNGYDERFILWEDGPFLAKMFSSNVKLEVDYSIKGIYYRLGGISTGNIHPSYLKDIELYRSTLVYEHYASLPKKVRLYVDHNYNSSKCSNKLSKILLYLKDWRIMMSKTLYKFRETVGKYYDKKFFNSIDRKYKF